MNLSEQVILITGASTGIGAALAETLATNYNGIRLVLTARNVDKLTIVADRCSKVGADVFIIPCDLAKVEEVKTLAKSAIEHFDRIDILVNNAGYGQMRPLELVPSEAALEQFAVNFHAPLILSQALIHTMRQQGGGRIINVSSLGGRMAFPVAGLYSCSKFALEALSDVLRMELKGFNIQVSVIEPGPVITDFFQVAWSKVLQNIPERDSTPYRQVFNNIKAIDKQVNTLGWSVERVAKVILKSLVDRHPRPRYIAATGGEILVFLMTKILPTWMKDEFWKRFYGIDRVEKEWEEKTKN